MKLTQWLFFTVLMSIMPVILKIIIVFASTQKNWNIAFSEVDFATLGITMSVTNLNEVNNEIFKGDNKWRLKVIAYSVALIFIFSTIITISTTAVLFENPQSSKKIFDIESLRLLSIIMVTIAFLYSFSIFKRISKLNAIQ